jgi:oxygen-independent coproporphyrinogen-3 oxidase
LGLETENVYLGGGTPSILMENDLECLFDLLDQYSITTTAREITVEAGRPDTLSTSKLELFRALGVNSICINPQTMQDATLQLIGRRHSRADIINSVQRVREAGIPNLNMDLIIGLPGEGMAEYKNTLAQILDLGPENITVHTLAVKKGSLLAESQGKAVCMNSREGKAGLHYIGQTLQKKDSPIIFIV